MEQIIIGEASFFGYHCLIKVGQYFDTGNKSLQLLCRDTYMPVAKATINIPEVLKNDEVIIKDYSENTGVLDALTQAKFLTTTGRIVKVGYLYGIICTFNDYQKVQNLIGAIK